LAKVLILFIIKTCRLKISGYQRVETLKKENKNIIFVYWHRHIFVTIYQFKDTGARPLISLSEDGEIIAQIAREFGMNPIRGSSSKGGAKAFLKLLNSIKDDNAEVLITADGPKGPLKQIKDGTILLAQKTNSVLVPIGWHSSRLKIFAKTWDKFKVPHPFSKIIYAYGEPFIIPRDIKKENFTSIKQEIKHHIDNLEAEVENYFD
jgi:lysophospholipid acyltransferase (LPLAT)-like uncharacterized protein